MSVRGSKSKIILYAGGICSIVFVILLYHNASQRLEEMEKLYERCHLNEESLSAQLQVNLEYKIRLEKSLQQEKSEHSQIKDDMQSKLEEEKQTRERENYESIQKFSALQQKYKLLQSQHEDVNLECNKLRQLQLSELEEKSRLENELKLVKSNRDAELKILKDKNKELENEVAILKADKVKLMNELSDADKHKSLTVLNSSGHQKVGADINILPQPELEKSNRSLVKSSTAANKADHEFVPSANNIYLNTSTPMINPDAVLSQDKILNAAAPVPQPRQETFPLFQAYENKENVGAKPEGLEHQPQLQQQQIRPHESLMQGVLHAPDLLNDFGHVPAIQQYKEKIRLGLERNNNGGEVGDEGEPLAKIPEAASKEKRQWKEGEGENSLLARRPAGGNLSKNEVYQYQAAYDGKKEEGEDDDDVDSLDYQHMNEKNQQEEPKADDFVKIPMENKHESVMIQPK